MRPVQNGTAPPSSRSLRTGLASFSHPNYTTWCRLCSLDTPAPMSSESLCSINTCRVQIFFSVACQHSDLGHSLSPGQRVQGWGLSCVSTHSSIFMSRCKKLKSRGETYPDCALMDFSPPLAHLGYVLLNSGCHLNYCSHLTTLLSSVSS